MLRHFSVTGIESCTIGCKSGAFHPCDEIDAPVGVSLPNVIVDRIALILRSLSSVEFLIESNGGDVLSVSSSAQSGYC